MKKKTRTSNIEHIKTKMRQSLPHDHESSTYENNERKRTKTKTDFETRTRANQSKQRGKFAPTVISRKQSKIRLSQLEPIEPKAR